MTPPRSDRTAAGSTGATGVRAVDLGPCRRGCGRQTRVYGEFATPDLQCLPHRTADRLMTTAWCPPSRLPTRAALEPPAPTLRQLLDHCVARITDALHDGDPSTAALFHRAARLLHDASAGNGTPDRW